MQAVAAPSTFYFAQVLFVVFCVVNGIWGINFREEDYYPPADYYARRQVLEQQVKLALDNLTQAKGPEWVPNWPDPSVKLGVVSGVALNSLGQLLVFHRGPNMWDASTFSSRHVYQKIGEPPIAQPTVLVFNDTGELVDQWGENMFYMPHGITVDGAGAVWVTDVATHQVMKFAANNRATPALVLGEKFVPRDDETHFCKPSAVAVSRSGEFFVADGYCNSRIIKFAPDGTRLLQWGRRSGDSPFVFKVPHALTLAEDRGLVIVADRERGRAAAFRADNGTYVQGFKNWLIGPRLFGVAYSPVHGGRLYIVNGPTDSGAIPVRGYVVDFESSRLLQTFAPRGGFANPHDVVVSPQGDKVYVAELTPYRAHKFEDYALHAERRGADSPGQPRPAGQAGSPAGQPVLHAAKPTATGEVSSSPLSPSAPWWRSGALGAAAGAAAVLALVALARTRNAALCPGRRRTSRRRWEYGGGDTSEFKLRRLLRRPRFSRVHSDDSEDEPAPMLRPPQAEAA